MVKFGSMATTFRYAAIIEYLGTSYSGFQRQKTATAVANLLDKTLSTIFREEIIVQASSRTDAGVHAVGQVVHFDSSTYIRPGKVSLGANAILPNDISMRKCVDVDENFHARFCVQDKTYVYRFYVSSAKSPVKAATATQIYKQPNLDLMRQAADMLVGTHDFKAFCSTGSDALTTIRTINKLSVLQEGENLTIEVNGDAFLYKMVRTIAGLLVKIGSKRAGLDIISQIFDTGERSLCGKTMPPQGLCLTYINYGSKYNKILYDR